MITIIKKIILTFLISLSSVQAKEWISTKTGSSREPKWNYRSVSNSEAEINFELLGYFLKELKKGEVTIEIPGGIPILKKGAPELPSITSSIAIPDLANMSIELINSSFVEINDVRILPSKGNLTRDINPSSVDLNYGVEYKKDEFYPKDLVFLRNPYIIRSVRGQTIVIQPFKYNPVSRILRVYTNVKIRIYEDGVSSINPLTTNFKKGKPLRQFESIYSRQFINYSSSITRYEPLNEDNNMLIICFDSFINAMQPLVEWKKLKGIRAEIVGLESVGETSVDIKNYVQNYYNNQGLTYLLLVGDIDQIPSPRFSEGAGTNSPADPYYSFIVGEDYYPDIFVGRFSAEDTTHVTTMVNRTIEYERYPNISGDWYKKGSGFASNEGPGDDGEYDHEHMEVIRGKLLAYNYDEIDQVYEPSGSVEDGEQAINEGRSIINYTGHGSSTAWGNGCPMNNTDVNNLVNIGKFPFIWTVACVTGEFNNGTCFAESWLRATHQGQPTGAVASFNSTVNAAWNPPMDAQDEMNDILVDTYSDNNTKTFGGLSINGCMHMNDNYGPDGYVETLYWTIFGDPSVEVRSNIPTNFNISHDGFILFDGSEYIVNVGEEGALVAITQNGTFLGSAYSAENGEARIFFERSIDYPTQLDLVITGYNKVPYQTTIDIISPDGPYLIIEDVSIVNENLTEENNRLDFAQTNNLSVNIENIGTEASDSITISIHHHDGLVSFSTQSIQVVGLDSARVDTVGPFQFNVLFAAEDQSLINFIIEITSGNFASEYPKSFVVNAPNYKLNSVLAKSSESVSLNPGENGNLEIILENTGHAPLPEPTFLLESNSQLFSIDSMVITPLSTWEIDSQITISSQLYINPSVTLGHSELLNLTIGSDVSESYEFYMPIPIIVGLKIEDFETGNFDNFDWIHSGDQYWEIQDIESFDGLHSARSGPIGNNQISELSLVLNIRNEGQISFKVKSSTESGGGIPNTQHDYLAFFIDEVDMGISIAGETDWKDYSFELETGEHSFKWLYRKNGSQSFGEDCVWLDQIIFPAGTLPVLNVNFGDLNADNNVNVLDIILTVASVLGYNEFNSDQLITGDVNLDNSIDIFDIIIISDKVMEND